MVAKKRRNDVKKAIVLAIAAIMAGGFILPAMADDYTTITMDLTDTASITVEPDTWEINGAAGSTDSTTFWLNNTGAVAVSVDVSTNASTDEGDWSLGTDAGHNTYYVRENYTAGPAWVNVTAGGYTFDSDLAASGQSGDSDEFTVEVGLPTSSTTTIQQTTRMTFTATAN
jgi:hypothetical protein